MTSRNYRWKSKKSVVLVMALSLSFFTACGHGGEGDVSFPEAPEISSGSDQQESTAIPLQSETEEQLRAELTALQDNSDMQTARIALYEELLARDLCLEEDYLKMAQLYADAGDMVSQRRILWWGFRLYPGEEYVRRLQELVVRRTADEEATAAVIASLQQALVERNESALRAVVQGEEWKEIFQEAPEIYATRTCYADGNVMAQIASDMYETEVFLLGEGGECLYGRLNDEGCLIGSAVYAGGSYNGDAEVCWFDSEGILYKRYQAVFRGDICVDSITVEYEGIIYTGVLGEDGSIKEEQQVKVTQAGGVVYAYQEGGKNFLWQENASAGAFRMDCGMLGLPRFKVWE